MKFGGRCALIAAVFFASIFFVSYKTGREFAAANLTGAAAQGTKTLTLQPTYPGYQIVEAAFNDVSAQCLACHGPTYEDLRAKTAEYTTGDYVYNGDYIQPHVYLGFSKGNHDDLAGINCLECHTAHELPIPILPVKKADLSYCLSCHHAGEFISCSECH
jgi:hypothetical protein